MSKLPDMAEIIFCVAVISTTSFDILGLTKVWSTFILLWICPGLCANTAMARLGGRFEDKIHNEFGD